MKGVRVLYSIGEKIVYGSEGVYFVAEYTSSPVDKNDTRQYYLLKPIFGPAGNIIFTPVDNDRVKMRPVMDEQSARSFIEKIPDVEILTVEREKNRRETYKSTLSNATPEDFLAIIKTVHVRREEFLRAKKRVAESDNDYEKKCKFCLYGELSLALGMSVEEIDQRVEQMLVPLTV